MKKSISLFLAINLILTYSGCATIVSGKTQDVLIHSDPTGANILIDGMIKGTTPMFADLIRNERHTIKISKAGYEEETRATARGFNWWYLGNIILGGVIGLIVDPITGAIFEIKPDKINVDLKPVVVVEKKTEESEKKNPKSS